MATDQIDFRAQPAIEQEQTDWIDFQAIVSRGPSLVCASGRFE